MAIFHSRITFLSCSCAISLLTMAIFYDQHFSFQNHIPFVARVLYPSSSLVFPPSHSQMSFDVLAKMGDDEPVSDTEDNKENDHHHVTTSIHLKSLFETTTATTSATTMKSKPGLTEVQKQILEEQKKAKMAKKQKAKQCHFFNDCGKLRQTHWPYCQTCYETKFGKCDTEHCPHPTTLVTHPPGTFHSICKSCRSSK